MAAASVRILLADDSVHWRHFLLTFAEHHPAWQIIRETRDGPETIQEIGALQPDLIFLDVCLPGINGIEVARTIRKTSPATRVLFLSALTNPVIVQAAFNAGGLGFVSKTDVAQDLPMAVEAVLAGKKFLSSSISEGPAET